MSGDLISRRALLKEIDGSKAWVGFPMATKMIALELTCAAPAVEAEPVVHAHWVPAPDIGDCCYRCSNCGRVIDRYYEDDDAYCARCGAHMDEEVADA